MVNLREFKTERKRNYKPFFLVLTTLIILAAIIFLVLAFVRFNEDAWIKDKKGIWIKHGNPENTPDYVLEQQKAIECASELYVSSILDGRVGCLGECGNYSVNLEGGVECEKYTKGLSSHIIRLNKDGQILKIL